MLIRLARVCITALLVGALGCVSGKSGRSTRDQQPADVSSSSTEGADSNLMRSIGLVGVAFDPPDLSTNLGTKPIRIYRGSGSEAHLMELAKFVTLHTIDGTPVAFDVKVVPYKGSTATDCPKKGECPKEEAPELEVSWKSDWSYLELLPLEPLADKWHVVSLHSLPDNYFVANVPIDQAPTPLFGAQYSVRVHPSPNPQVRNLVISGDLDKDFIGVTVNLSEPIRLADLVSAVALQVGATKCEPYKMSEWSEEVFEKYIDWFGVICQTTPGTDKSKWHFSMKEGAKSAIGKPLRVFPDHETWSQELEIESVKLGEWPTGMGAIIQW